MIPLMNILGGNGLMAGSTAGSGLLGAGNGLFGQLLSQTAGGSGLLGAMAVQENSASLQSLQDTTGEEIAAAAYALLTNLLGPEALQSLKDGKVPQGFEGVNFDAVDLEGLQGFLQAGPDAMTSGIATDAAPEEILAALKASQAILNKLQGKEYAAASEIAAEIETIMADAKTASQTLQQEALSQQSAQAQQDAANADPHALNDSQSQSDNAAAYALTAGTGEGNASPEIPVQSLEALLPIMLESAMQAAGETIRTAHAAVTQTATPSVPVQPVDSQQLLQQLQQQLNQWQSQQSAQGEQQPGGQQQGQQQGFRGHGFLMAMQQPESFASHAAANAQSTFNTALNQAAVDGGAPDGQPSQAQPQSTLPNIGMHAMDRFTQDGLFRMEPVPPSQHSHNPPQPPEEQVALQIHKAVQQGVDRFSIRLQPAELGRVDVRLDINSEGRATIAIIASSAEALDVLQQGARKLELALQEAGLDASADSFDFSHRGERQDSQPQPSFASSYGEEDLLDDPDPAMTEMPEEEGTGQYLLTPLGGVNIQV